MDDQIFKYCLHQTSLFEHFENHRNFFYKLREIFYLFLFYNVHKENMFTIDMKYGREAP